MHKTFISVMIIGLAVVLYYFSSELTVTRLEADRNNAVPEVIFDSYSEGISTVFYNEDGEVDYTLRAKRQVHLKNQSTLLEKPFVQFFKEGESHWNIVAESGHVARENDTDIQTNTIQLSGDVEVHTLDDYGNPTVLSTPLLEINPNSETLETEDAVHMVTTNIIHSGLGMFADLKRDEIYFYSENSGHYEPLEKNVDSEK